MESFTVRELRERSGELSQAAEKGELSLVTKHGTPLFVSVPFTERLLDAGVHTALALGLYKSGDISSGKAAKLCRVPRSQFLEYASLLGIPVVDYDPGELATELQVLG